MPKFVVGQGRGLFPPIEVEIGGKVLQVKMNRAVSKEMLNIRSEFKENSIEAIYKELEILLGGPSKEIDDLDSSVAVEMFSYIMDEMKKRRTKPDADDGGEKNAQKPGADVAP